MMCGKLFTNEAKLAFFAIVLFEILFGNLYHIRLCNVSSRGLAFVKNPSKYKLEVLDTKFVRKCCL